MTTGEVGVLLEELRSQFKVFGEALQGTREVLERKIDGVDARLRRVETDVGILKTDVAVLKTDVAVLKTDMRDVKQRLGRVEKHVGLNGAPAKKGGKSRP